MTRDASATRARSADARGLVGSAAASAWTFRWAILASLFLVSPVILYDFGLTLEAGRGIDKLSLFAFPASILWVVAAQSVLRRLWLAHLLLLPFYVATAVDLFLVLNYEARLTSSTISMMLENLHHSGDFAQTQLVPLIATTVAVASLFAVAVLGMRRLEVRSWRPLCLSLAGLVAIYSAVGAYRAHALGGVGEGIADVISHDRNSPFGVFPQGYLAYQIYEDALEHQRRAGSFSFGATRAGPVDGPEIYVLVVGESSRRDHWSLYGYDRPTNARLAREPNLMVFRDMVTQAALTQISVPLMITRSAIEDLGARASEKSIISAFKEVGFTTYWLSTQQRDQFTGAINRYSGEADHARFMERRHDGVLVEAMKSIVEETRKANAKLFFVLHTQGSHFVFKDRYPAAAATFEGGATERDKLIDQYDNSIAYTDRVLADAIAVLKDRGGVSALIYSADHGENLYDDDRQLFGHFLNNEHDMPIPAFLWVSDRYAAAFPQKLAAARENIERPLNTRVIFSTLADLADLHIPDMDLSKMSVVGTGLRPYARMFIKHERLTDFDEWLGANRPEHSAPPGSIARR